MQQVSYRIQDLNVKISVHDLLHSTIDLLFGVEVDLRADPIPDLDSCRRCTEAAEFLDKLMARYPEVNLEEHVKYVAVG